MIKKMSDIAITFIEAMARPGAPLFQRVLLWTWVKMSTPAFWLCAYFEQAEYWAMMKRHHRLAAVCNWCIEAACVPHLIGVCLLAVALPREASDAR